MMKPNPHIAEDGVGYCQKDCKLGSRCEEGINCSVEWWWRGMKCGPGDTCPYWAGRPIPDGRLCQNDTDGCE